MSILNSVPLLVFPDNSLLFFSGRESGEKIGNVLRYSKSNWLRQKLVPRNKMVLQIPKTVKAVLELGNR